MSNSKRIRITNAERILERGQRDFSFLLEYEIIGQCVSKKRVNIYQDVGYNWKFDEIKNDDKIIDIAINYISDVNYVSETYELRLILADLDENKLINLRSNNTPKDLPYEDISKLAPWKDFEFSINW